MQTTTVNPLSKIWRFRWKYDNFFFQFAVDFLNYCHYWVFEEMFPLLFIAKSYWLCVKTDCPLTVFKFEVLYWIVRIKINSSGFIGLMQQTCYRDECKILRPFQFYILYVLQGWKKATLSSFNILYNFFIHIICICHTAITVPSKSTPWLTVYISKNVI